MPDEIAVPRIAMPKVSSPLALAAALVLTAALFSSSGADAPATNSAPTISLALEEKLGCSNNLSQIFSAIQAFQKDRQDLPNWLSDLVPQYLPDANILTCPLCRRTGRTEPPPLADPNISSSYLFEFCPLPLGNLLAGDPNRTRREWKRRQMGLVGSSVPIVRCRHHNGNSMNLAFDGRIYEGPGQWEQAFTNLVRLEELSPAKLFSDVAPQRPRTANTNLFPVRDKAARPALLNLSRFYNLALSDPIPGKTTNSLAALPRGLQTLSETEFDIRGIIQLSGRSITNKNWPKEIKGIPVSQKARRLHFLHAAAVGAADDEGKQAGSYVVYFAKNQTRLEIPIVYGRDLRIWQKQPDEKAAPPELAIAWESTAATPKATGDKARIFKTTWDNLVPDLQIEKLDFISASGGVAPFLIAITVE